MKKIFFLLLIAVAAAIGWLAHGFTSHAPAPAAGRKVLFYQSAMHPWIKSDKPGKCTICGMDLVPVYEGDKGHDVATGLVTLGSNSIQVIHVQTEMLKRRPLQRTLRVAGTIDDNDTRHRRLSAYVDGRIEKLFVNFVGAEVGEGQPLATFYSPTLLAMEREYVALLRPSPADSSTLLTERQRLLETAALRLKRLGLTAAQIAALARKSAAESQTEILAPMSGTVVAREIYEGQYVREGDRLFELADFSTMWFQFDLYERDLAWVKPGQTVDVTTPSQPGKVYSAPITFIDPNISDSTRSAKVRVELANPLDEANGQKRRELFHKLYAEGLVRLDIPAVLAVPRLAVLSTGERVVAYVDKGNGAYEQRQLRLGRRGDDYWEVLAGLREGEHVVTSGNLLLDAQSQLNDTANETGGSTPTAGETIPQSTPAMVFTEPQQTVTAELLARSDTLADALANDRLSDFAEQALKLRSLVAPLQQAFPKEHPLNPFIGRVALASAWPAADDLKAARASFAPFSAAMAELAGAARRLGAFKNLKIYKCPMAPRPGLWVQRQGPLQNPFMGRASGMITCGAEVQP